MPTDGDDNPDHAGDDRPRLPRRQNSLAVCHHCGRRAPTRTCPACDLTVCIAHRDGCPECGFES